MIHSAIAMQVHHTTRTFCDADAGRLLANGMRTKQPQILGAGVIAFISIANIWPAAAGGMLATWMRIKYPHILDGAIAGSAPIWSYLGEVSRCYAALPACS